MGGRAAEAQQAAALPGRAVLGNTEAALPASASAVNFVFTPTT